MLKNKLKLLLVLIVVISIALSPLCFADDETQATDDKATTESVSETTTENQVQEQALQIESNSQQTLANIKHSDEYLIGDSVTVDYSIDGNLFVIANELTINSQIAGNVFAIADKITIDNQGYISSSLYALGSDIEMNGIVYDSYTASNNLTISGYVFRDCHCTAENYNLYGVIGRNVFALAENYSFQKIDNSTITSQGKISGDFNYEAENEIEIPTNSVAGNTNYSKLASKSVSPNYIFIAISSIIFVLATWGLLKWLAPKFLANVDKNIKEKPGKTIGFGLLALVCLPIVAALLLFTGVAASVGLLTLSAYLILVCISRSVSIIAINNVIATKLKFEKALKNFLLLIVTSLVAWALTLIPFVGGLLNLAFVIVGMGVITRKLISKKEKETEE